MTTEDKWHLLTRCVCAGAAGGIGDIITHPVETAKVRLQIQGEASLHDGNKVKTAYRGMLHTMYTVGQQEGVTALYNGLISSVKRQFVHSAIRIGCYQPVKRFYLHSVKGVLGDNLNKVTDTAVRILAACSVSAIGVVTTQPMDVVKLRFQAMNTHSGNEKRYSGIVHAYRTIFREEGFNGLMRGTTANVVRNGICSASELVSYDIIKENLLKLQLVEDNVYCHLTSALCAGVVATITTCPADVLKARLMNSSNGVYSGIFHCVTVMLKTEGPSAFYKGVIPLYCRMGSWSVVMFLSYEQLKKRTMHHM